MSETPLPEMQMAAREIDEHDDAQDTHDVDAEERADSEDRASLNVGRSHAASNGRPLSAVGTAPMLFAPLSHEDSSEEAAEQEPPAPQPDDDVIPADESDFVAILQAAGILRELSRSELQRIETTLLRRPGAARRLDLLEAYYGGAGDAVAALRRRATDRWFVYHETDTLGAPQLMQRLLGVVPELSGAHLERVGASSGTLVMRHGDHLCALDEEPSEHGTDVVCVNEIVRAINVLLERRGVRARLVGLLADGRREAYVALPSLMNALTLVEADYLTALDAEALMASTAW